MSRHSCARVILALGLLFGFGAPALSAQTNPEDPPAKLTGADTEDVEPLLPEVFPDAWRFEPRAGNPPVWRAYKGDPAKGEEVLAGFVFMTSDVPPEEKGYSAPIRVLVGMDLAGKITGTRVTYYVESLRSSRGDFLRGFYQEQFTGKRMTDRFLVRRDIETVSGATITASAAARGIRNAARRVAAAYLINRNTQPALTPEDIEKLPWPELEMRGISDQLVGVDGNVLKIHLSLVPLADTAMGRLLIGNEGWNRAVSRLGRSKMAAKRPWVVGVDGTIMMLFRGPQLSVIRGQDTLRFAMADLSLIGDPREGKMSGNFRNVGVLLADSTLDPKQNFRWEMNFGSGIPIYSLQHIGDPVLYAQQNPPPAPVAAPAVARAEGPDAAQADSQTAAASDSTAAAVTVAQGPSAEPAAPLVDPSYDPAMFDFEAEESQSVLERTLETTSWPLVGVTAFILLVTTAAFFAKIVWLRWLALALTLSVLGFAEGDFLSVSHITAAIKVGPSVFLEDIPLLLLVAFTVVTTLLWGRVFCGYLCPFGALQDFLEHVVPKKLRRKFPHPVHEKGQYIKYIVLAVILIPALMGSQISTFQYFEPFGTVFFWSRSTILWLIAGAILVASAIIPRFYCRYACPLGASLALASLVSPFRIKRVPHCTLCTVCEHSCPTGAIKRDEVDFRECVRCNICEVKLKTEAGVCGHDLERITALIQIKRGPHALNNPMPEAASGDWREALRITAVAGLGVALSAVTVRELIERATLRRVSVTRTQLGTAVTVTVMHPDEVAGRSLVERTLNEVERLEGILSRYRATSPVAALNREGIVRGAPPELVQVVSRALEYSQMTDGAFDPTVAPVLNLYVSRFAQGEALPSDAEIGAVHALVGWRDLHVDGTTIALARPGMAITLDAIAKGYVVDRGVAALQDGGAERVIVQASGDMHAAGADDEPWMVGVQDPHDPRGTLGVVELSGSIASSGDYMQSFTPDRSLNHIIDPRTGRSPLHSSGTTVLAPTAIDADAASTAAFVLGPEAGIAFLDRLEGVEGMLVDKDGARFMSKGFGRELA